MPHLMVLSLDWWSVLSENDPAFSYYPNPHKTWTMVKEEFLETANALFESTDVSISSEGRNFLGCPMGIKFLLLSNPHLTSVLRQLTYFSEYLWSHYPGCFITPLHNLSN